MNVISRIACSASLLGLFFSATGCQSGRGTGTLAGAGVGALIGQLAGGTATSTLIGAGVGAAGGYIIGNEADRRQARQRTAAAAPTPVNELQPLAGTNWTLTSITPESSRNFSAMVIEFRSNGVLVTTRTENDGSVRTDEEYFRVVNNTLIVNDRDYILNGPFILNNRSLTFVVGDVTSRWTRIGG
jgi:hypothetical protein